MKNLKVQFKLIICVLLFLNTFNILTAKNTDEFYDAKDITNYFSILILRSKILFLIILRSTHDNFFLSGCLIKKAG